MQVFDYEDIQLIPRKCIVNSRKECDTSVKFGKHTFRMPVVPSNMETVIDEELAITLAKDNYFYVMHRFDEESRIPFIKKMQELELFSSISVGVKDYEYGFILKLKELAKAKKIKGYTKMTKEELQEALKDENTALISIDTKDKVVIGPYSRKGKSRIFAVGGLSKTVNRVVLKNIIIQHLR